MNKIKNWGKMRIVEEKAQNAEFLNFQIYDTIAVMKKFYNLVDSPVNY